MSRPELRLGYVVRAETQTTTRDLGQGFSSTLHRKTLVDDQNVHVQYGSTASTNEKFLQLYVLYPGVSMEIFVFEDSVLRTAYTTLRSTPDTDIVFVETIRDIIHRAWAANAAKVYDALRCAFDVGHEQGREDLKDQMRQLLGVQCTHSDGYE